MIRTSLRYKKTTTILKEIQAYDTNKPKIQKTTAILKETQVYDTN